MISSIRNFYFTYTLTHIHNQIKGYRAHIWIVNYSEQNGVSYECVSLLAALLVFSSWLKDCIYFSLSA